LGVAAVYGILHVVLYPVLLFVAFIPVLVSFGLFILEFVADYTSLSE
jgi:hypothetical protein